MRKLQKHCSYRCTRCDFTPKSTSINIFKCQLNVLSFLGNSQALHPLLTQLSPQHSHHPALRFSKGPMSTNNHVNYSRSGLLSQSATDPTTCPKSKIAYKEPLGSTNPPPKYRLYTFKEGKELEMTPLVDQSFFLIGRDHSLCTIQAAHPSISKQHAVIQFRREFVQSHESQLKGEIIVPYLMDLHSANGTLLNQQSIQSGEYYELHSGDLFKLGTSSREYVFIKED